MADLRELEIALQKSSAGEKISSAPSKLSGARSSQRKLQLFGVAIRLNQSMHLV
jgi:hypothetical protein